MITQPLNLLFPGIMDYNFLGLGGRLWHTYCSGFKKDEGREVTRVITGVKTSIIIAVTLILTALLRISLQADQDTTIKVESLKFSNSPPAPFPFDLQIQKAKERIKYLAQKYPKTDTISLLEVFVGPYGDKIFGSPHLYDWDRVLKELERQSYIKILQTEDDNIIFRVLPKLLEEK